jgi:hypothetical protein
VRKFVSVSKVFKVLALVLGLVPALSENAVASWQGAQTWVTAQALTPGQNVVTIARGNIGSLGYYQSPTGGEFRMTNAGSVGAGQQFWTFCVEAAENINIPGTYSYNVSTSSDATGAGNPGAPNHLRARTAALYREFLREKDSNVAAGLQATNRFFQDTLGTVVSNADTIYNSNARAGALQDAIWHFQGYTVSNVATNKYISAVNALATVKGWAAGMLATALNPVDNAKYGDVRIMNLFNANGGRVQSQLVRAFDSSSTVVPEPASVSLFLCGLAGLCGFVRRRKAATV